MKRKFTVLLFSASFFLLLGSMVISSCTKEGPEGPPGMDGEDASTTCMTCHDFSDMIIAKIGQYERSLHASGNNINRSNEGCSQCHTSQGFRTFLADGSLSNVHEPAAINCRTCHPIHETYTTDDYKLRTNDAVTLAVGGATYDHGNSNLCVHCHQSRPINPMPSPGGPEINVTNARIGPHYGPQSNIFLGKGAFEIPGSLPYENSYHTNILNDGCVTCHMSPPVGYLAGGHQMNVKYGTASYNYSGCTTSGCHESAANLTVRMNNNREEISLLTQELKDILISKELLNASNSLIPTPKTMTSNELGAIINYRFVYYDQSYGAHNFKYVKALLTNTLESLN